MSWRPISNRSAAFCSRLFFMAVGLSLQIDVIIENYLLILIAVPLLMGIKALVIYGLCRLTGSPHNDAMRIGAAFAAGRRIRLRPVQRSRDSRCLLLRDGLAADRDRDAFHGADAAGFGACLAADAGAGRASGDHGGGLSKGPAPMC